MAKSPSIDIREIDASSYTVTNSETMLAIVGFATKGPVGKAQMITSKNEFIEKYGTIPMDSPYGHLAAYRAFNQTNKLVYYRVASGDTGAEHVILNAKAARGAYQEFSSPNPTFWMEAGDYGFSLKVDTTTPAGNVIIGIATDGWYTLEDVKTKLNVAIQLFETGNKDCVVGVVNGKLRVVSDKIVSGSEIEITAPALETTVSLIDSDYLGTVGTMVAYQAAVAAASTDTILIKSKETGSSTNNISVVKTSSVNPVNTSETLHTVQVYYSGNLVEAFSGLSLSPLDPNYFLDVVSKDPQNGGSKWIEMELERVDPTSTTVVLFPNGVYALGSGSDEFDDDDDWEEGDYDYKVGTDGVPTGSSTALFVTALGTNKDLANTEIFDFHILITPDNGSVAVQNAALTLAESRQDFIYVADPPFGLDYNEAVSWHNGGGYGRNTALNSSYASTYWSWAKEFNTQSEEYTWVPPSVYIAELYLATDRNFAPWAAPAGEARGRLITSDIEHSPSFAEREVLYGDMNSINPIVEFAAKGVMVYGQKTTLRANSAVNRVNVRRMLIFVKKLVKKAMEGMVFDPHTPESWFKASSMVTNILDTVKARGGISDYLVSINDATNTQNLIAQGIMRGVITIVPIGTIERIELEIKFLSPGASIGE